MSRTSVSGLTSVLGSWEELVDAERWERMVPGVPPRRILAGSTFLHYEDHAKSISAWRIATGPGRSE
jgi:hypothetical protein